ncbi:hypothetical protein U0070_022055 [Myodes glareolus]|uniref:Uncharacterized protein n=1 Tax=Myodes glareolus TaxID=447135 RepID=A0AAW0I921_MYOGA
MAQRHGPAPGRARPRRLSRNCELIGKAVLEHDQLASLRDCCLRVSYQRVSRWTERERKPRSPVPHRPHSPALVTSPFLLLFTFLLH